MDIGKEALGLEHFGPSVFCYPVDLIPEAGWMDILAFLLYWDMFRPGNKQQAQ